MKNFLKSAVLIFIPLIMFAASFLFLFNLNNMPSSIQSTAKYFSYIIFLAAAVISWWFNRSRIFFCIVILAVSQLIISMQIANDADKIFYVKEAYSFISVFIPINIFIISFFKERGILTIWGISRIIFLLIQPLFFALWVGTEKKELSGFFSVNFFLKDWSIFNILSQTSLAVFLIAAVTLILRYILYELYVDISFVFILPLLIASLYMRSNEQALPVFFAAAGIILAIAVIRDSYFMAFMDELTGLPSRRALKHELLKLSGRYTIAMLDVDFFKKFNDKYGHDVGDQVLKLVAVVMREVGGGGKPFRYGGEEFTIVFPGKILSDAIPYLEELRENISKRGFTQRSKDRPKKKPKNGGTKSGNGKQLFVTVSIGVAEKSEKYKQPEEVIKAADTALYRAKKKGRNCVSK